MAYTYYGNSPSVADKKGNAKYPADTAEVTGWGYFKPSGKGNNDTNKANIDYLAALNKPKNPPKNPSGGGGSRGRRSLNLKVYKRLGYNNKGVKQNAKTLSEAQLREALTASRIGRNQSATRYGNTVREMDYANERDYNQNRDQLGSALAGGANVALNRGMGYGQGYLNTVANQNLNYDRMANELANTYAMQLANALDTQNSEMYGYDQQDALARQNKIAQYIEFLNSLDATAFNKYYQTEGLRQAEVASENQRRSAL